MCVIVNIFLHSNLLIYFSSYIYKFISKYLLDRYNTKSTLYKLCTIDVFKMHFYARDNEKLCLTNIHPLFQHPIFWFQMNYP